MNNKHQFENSEALPKKEDIDENVEKILKMLRTESGAISSDSSLDMAELASLIDNLHKGYQAVHGRNDHLMGILKKRNRHKGSDNGSFSIDVTSDSYYPDSGSEDLSDSYAKSDKLQEGKASYVSLEDYQDLQEQLENMKVRYIELETAAVDTNTKLKEEQTLATKLAETARILQVEMDVLRKELDLSLNKEDDTNQKLSSLQEEIVALRSENAEALSTLQKAYNSHEYFQIQLNKIKGEMHTITCENSILKEGSENLSQEIASLHEQLKSTSEEKEALRSGNFKFLRRIQEAEKTVADLRGQADQKKLATEELKSQNDNLSSENESLKRKLAVAAQRETNMIQRFSAAKKGVSSLKSEILRLSNLTRENEKTIGEMRTESGLLRDENLKLLNINNDLNQRLEAKVIENEALGVERLEDIEIIRRAEEMTSLLSIEIETLKNENSKLLAENEKLRLELEASNDDVAELRLFLKYTEDENQILATENSAVFKRMQQAEKTIEDIKAEAEKLGSDKSQLQIKIKDLDFELGASNSQLSDLNKALTAADEERRALVLEVSGLTIKLHQAEINMKDLENELEHFKGEISMQQQNQMKAQEAEQIIDDIKAEVEQLRADNYKLKTENSNLGLELEASRLQLTDVGKKLVILEEEGASLKLRNSTVISKLQQAEICVEKLENDLMQLREENSMLHQSESKLKEVEGELKEEIKQLISMLEQSERKLKEFEGEHTEEIKQLSDDNSQLQIQIKDTNRELEAANLQLVDLKKLTEASEEEKTSLTSEIVTTKGELQQLEINVQTLEAALSKLHEENSMLENSQNDLQTQKTDLEEKLQEKDNTIRELEERCRELWEKLKLTETEKREEGRENEKLTKKMQTLEVQLRLSNQRLKITETESKEKVERYARSMEVMNDERMSVEEQMLGLCRKMNFLDTEVRQLKGAAEAGILALGEGYIKLETDFGGNTGHILKELSRCNEELKLLKKWVTDLKDEKQGLSNKLKNKEGIMLMMKDEVAKREKELTILRANARQSEERTKLLEEMLMEKKREVSDKDEAKREAIRQLCLRIEYHRENCDHLHKYLSSVLKRTGRTS